MANNLAVTNGVENIFGAFGGTQPDETPQSTVPSNWGSGVGGTSAPVNVFQPQAPPIAQTPAVTPQTPSAAPAQPLDPMRFFRNDVGGYNPRQYANDLGISSVGSFLGTSAQFGQTRNEGPFGMTPQSIVNWGGENHNTGLVQNLINQYGPEAAMRMMNDQAKFASSNGGGNWTLQNDSSSNSFVPNIFLSAQPNQPQSQPNNPTQNSAGQVTATNPNTQGNNPNSASSILAALFGLGGQQ